MQTILFIAGFVIALNTQSPEYVKHYRKPCIINCACMIPVSHGMYIEVPR